MTTPDLQPRRDLTLIHATSLVVGICIGTGVFLKSAAMAQAVGTPALVLAAWAVAGWVLHDPLTRRRWWLVPLQDVVSFLVWVGGFFGNTILWRGRKYHLRADGRFEPIESRLES